MTTLSTGAVPTREELRRLIRAIETRPLPPRRSEPPRRLTVEEALPGEWARLDGSLYIRHTTLGLDHEHGRQPLADLACAMPEVIRLLAGNDEVEGATVHDLVFLDIETTGLGGAGALVFLVTTAWVDDARLAVRQYLAGSPADEGALLARLIGDLREAHDAPVLVTYNGRAFDAPMLDQRGTMHRMRGTFEAMPHLDLLSPMRRGFRGVLPSCRLMHIEDRLLGVTRPPDEVSGGDVPSWYFRWLRSGDARHLVPLVAHNGDDVVSLAALVARFAALEAGRPGTGIEHLALGRLHASAGQEDAACHHLHAARGLLPPSLARDEALFALAGLHRRARRHDLAAGLWREIAARSGAEVARALTELAKHLEHVERAPLEALGCVDRAIETIGPTLALTHRRSRLLAKLAR